MKKRQLKKIFKIVARQINSGNFTKLKPVYFRTIDKAIYNFLRKRYINEFRPWWYEDDVRWRELDLKTELSKYHDRWVKDFEEWSGINMDLYAKYFWLNHK
ncbi:hypothetical protein ACKE5C_19365 (plasmid) [Aneurinibacillus thermoaerophilus]|uniref:Uncharacterized protein n=1 Tax=Aneurinibacillus thermoaerophilus TaxID=143495 RepID=A0ABX8YGN7_ANETH|nr:hypothetical protein [Aneurinibacillus thermoaerophilus]QYY44736.1 hypothetical protein K3F53_19015 [Aneurinibacillus thermoaerophilus]